MQTSSEATGTALVLQLAALNQLPLPLADHETVQPLALAADGAHIDKSKIAVIPIRVKRIARARVAARSERDSPSISLLRVSVVPSGMSAGESARAVARPQQYPHPGRAPAGYIGGNAQSSPRVTVCT